MVWSRNWGGKVEVAEAQSNTYTQIICIRKRRPCAETNAASVVRVCVARCHLTYVGPEVRGYLDQPRSYRRPVVGQKPTHERQAFLSRTSQSEAAGSWQKWGNADAGCAALHVQP